MRKHLLIMGICLFTLSGLPVERVLATDYTLLETLIAAHKRQSNKLKDRTATGAAKMGTGEILKENSLKYKEMVKKVSQRMGDLYSYLTFAEEMARATVLTKEVIELEAKAIDLSIKAAKVCPEVLDMATELHHDFGIMTGKITALTIFVVSSGLNVTMATMKQRKDFTDYILSELMIMKRKLRRFNYYANVGLVAGRCDGVFDYFKSVKHTEIVKKVKAEIKKI